MFWVVWFSLVCVLRFAEFTLPLLISIVNLVDFLCLTCCWVIWCCWLCDACWFLVWMPVMVGLFAFVGLVIGLFVVCFLFG